MMILAKEICRPRLRTASMLFGVVAAATAAQAATHYALSDRDGAPACGNIGQSGRPVVNLTIVTQPTPPVARPLVDATGDPAPGNVMSKSSRSPGDR
jgi:hypothetical protein